MSMYKEISSKPYQTDIVLRLDDNTYIPKDPSNSDFQLYLKWLEEGNQPEPADD